MSWVSDRRLQYFYDKIKTQIKNYIQRTKAINLLDNSDFTNPINTNGATTYTGSKYTIDRWKANSGYSIVTVNADSLNIKSSNGNTVYFQQFIEGGAVKAGRTYTVACTLKDGSVHCMSGVASTDMTEAIRYMYVNGVSLGTVRFKYDSYYESYMVMLSTSKTDGIDVVNVALYEGEYTNDTLPIYQPKGYSIEAVICSGGSLNFKVVGGTTQPTNLSENTVWVNTDTEISGYAFSATEPTNPVAGMVWFQTGTTSSAAMNIDKKNSVMLYPTKCQQYIGGAWTSKIAKTYLNGTWVDWWKDLYASGELGYELATGFTTLTSTTTVQETSAYIKYYNVTSTGNVGGISSEDPVDVTGYSTLKIKCRVTFNTSATGKYKCGLAKTKSLTDWIASASIPYSSADEIEVNIPVPADGGKYYLVFTCGAVSNDTANTQHVRISGIRLEA